MTHNNFIYIAVMDLVSYAIRVLPLTLIRKPIKNQFIQSFLYYVPYVTLAVMTFPAIVEATQSPVAGAVALVVGILAAWFGASLFQVSVACCAVVFVIEHLHTACIIILICYVQDYLAHFIHFYDIVQIHSAHFAVTLSSFL